MKNVEQKFLTVISTATKAIMILLLFLGSTSVKADIINPTASIEGGYYPGQTSTIVVDVSFDSNTSEYADFIEVRLVGPIAGLSLWHGAPTPSPYIGCGLNKGDEMTATGPGWGRPGFIAGNSQCGAFETGTTHQFGIDIIADANVSGSFGIEVRIVGDGNGEAAASEEIVSLTVQQITCMIICPDDIIMTAPASSCATMVNVAPPTLTGMCTATPPGVSDLFPVGETEVKYQAMDDNGIAVHCVTLVTIIDDEDPFVSGGGNIEVDLGPGECGFVIPQNFAVTENCIEPEVMITQNDDLTTFEEGVNCPGGTTSYLRVFDTNDEGINTELNIEEISFGVAEAFGSPTVTVNVYTLDGVLSYANMELVGSGSEVLPNFQNGLYSIPVSAVIEAGQVFVVEIVVPGSQFNGVIVAMNNHGQSAPSYIASDFCGAPEPITLDQFNYGAYGSIILVEGYQSSYVINPVGNSPLIGDEAPIGVTQVDYEVVDASGNSTSVNFTVTVNGFDDFISAIACNDEVQVSLDEECMEIVTADMILEGGPYACFDEYIVEIEDDEGNNYGNVVTGDNIGQNLTVRVTGPNNNSCWGKLIVEDKAPAFLDCIDVVTTCFGDIYPGAPIAERVTFPASITQFNETISEGVPSTNMYTFPVNGLVKATITNIAVRVNIAHDSISELSASIMAPDGTTAVLFINPGQGCTDPNIQITLDDDAFNTNVDLINACSGMSPAISGAFQPNQLLSIFDGNDPNGDWTLIVSDTESGTGGTVLGAELVISQSGGIVTFPTENDVIAQTEGNNSYTVLGIDGCGSALLSYNDLEFDQDCSSPYSKVIQRSWSAVDESGNTSTTCVQNIYIYRNGLATLMFPPNYDDLQEPSLSCSDYADAAPPTSVTGAPFGDLCDNVQVFPYTDTRIDICEGSYKLVRHFELLEWCSGEVVEHNQIIKVLDKEGPVVEEVEDITVSAGEYDCTADFVAIPPAVISDCSSEFTYELFYLVATDAGDPPVDGVYFDTNVTETPSGNFIIADLPFNRIWAKWRIHDQCDNFTDEYFTITVNDQVNPIAVCDEFTVVSIGSDGYTEVYATTFDDGSIDNCGIVEMRVRKMEDVCFNNTTFGDRVTFCCEEVGETIMVAFEVTDISGNKNTCMVEVEVQDKLPPYITLCPPDITLDCQADYEDLSVTGEPEYIDNCEVISVTYVDDANIDNCGEGLVRRTWTVEDREGLKGSCVQEITLFDDDPFTENDITWPLDYDASTCNTDLQPDNLGVLYAYPRYEDDNCSLVATVWEDKVFTFVDGACEKILREWTVIDWCRYNEANPVLGQGLYKHLQVIKLLNQEAPEFTNCADEEVEVFGDCEGLVEFTIEATDDCTPSEDIYYTYQIDAFSDGIDAIDFNLNGESASFSRILPIGEHTVNWTAEDKCGNFTYCEMKLTVVDGKQPSPYCLSSITTVVMNNSGSIDIWANDFDYGSYDNCTPQEDLIFSFSQNVLNTSMTFTCNDIPNGVEEQIQVEMWVTDAAGNQDFCSITLILQDSQEDVCTGAPGLTAGISGSLRTENFNYVEDVEVTAFSPTLEVNEKVMTNNQGKYYATELPKGSGYRVKAFKNDDLRNGVSTLDLVLIQRHILGLTELDSPYKIIASDINNDGEVKSSDLVSMRKVILGIIDEFPNGQTSWRFMPKGTTFPDVTHPFPFNEEINIGQLNTSMIGQDLMAVKIGDVNGNVVTNLEAGIIAENRSSKRFMMEVEDLDVKDGDRIYVPVYATGIKDLLGYQFTLNMNNAEFVDVESNQLEVNAENFGVYEDLVTMSWSSIDGVELNSEEPLFTLILDVYADTEVSKILDLNSDVTSAEAYDSNYGVYDVELGSRNSIVNENKFAVFQNRPNPFMESTNISFYLPEAMDVELVITDVTGRLVSKSVRAFGSGKQNVEIKYSDLGTSTGVLYYTVKAGEFTATKKMINVR
ncbi:MAG: proprotein convertase P-domain-containing protein [Saprospiraceae bacterium]|nr:proprotein convertase P-domain-containing protein [Saprospiraceae bacterium]